MPLVVVAAIPMVGMEIDLPPGARGDPTFLEAAQEAVYQAAREYADANNDGVVTPKEAGQALGNTVKWAYDKGSQYLKRRRSEREKESDPPPPAPSGPMAGSVSRSRALSTRGRLGKTGRIRSPGYKSPRQSRLRTTNVDTFDQKGVGYIGYKTFNRADLYRILARRLWTIVCDRASSHVVNEEQVPDAFAGPISSDGTMASLTPETCAISKVEFVFRTDLFNNGGHDKLFDQSVVTWSKGRVPMDGWSEEPPAPYGALNDLYNATFSSQTDDLGKLLQNYAQNSKYLTTIRVYRADLEYVLVQNEEDQVGRNFNTWWFDINEIHRMKMNASCSVSYKFQNTTGSGTGETGTGQTTDIQANPLYGRMYCFSNPTPRFRMQWLEQSDENITRIMATEERDSTLDNSQVLTLYLRHNVAGQANPDASTALLPGFKQPPHNPTTIFKNLSGTAKLYMPAGGYITHHTGFSFDGTVKKFMLGTYGSLNGANQPGPGRNYASTGDCFIMALQHDIRDSVITDQSVRLVCNRSSTYTCMLTKLKKLACQAKVDMIAPTANAGTLPTP